MPQRGLEPLCSYERLDLNEVRLPISPPGLEVLLPQDPEELSDVEQQEKNQRREPRADDQRND